MRYIESIVLHHTAVDSEEPQYNLIDRYHMQRWGRGIEYHYFLERENSEPMVGQPLDVIGWHAGEANKYSVGICLAGKFRVQKPTDSQIQSLNTLLLELQKRFGIPDQRIFLHREVRPTSCPVVDLRRLALQRRKKSNGIQSKIRSLTRGIARATGKVKEMLKRVLARLLKRMR